MGCLLVAYIIALQGPLSIIVMATGFSLLITELLGEAPRVLVPIIQTGGVMG